jgi:hypothetical protein
MLEHCPRPNETWNPAGGNRRMVQVQPGGGVIATRRIPPVEIGGWFKSSLQMGRLGFSVESHRWKRACENVLLESPPTEETVRKRPRSSSRRDSVNLAQDLQAWDGTAVKPLSARERVNKSCLNLCVRAGVFTSPFKSEISNLRFCSIPRTMYLFTCSEARLSRWGIGRVDCLSSGFSHSLGNRWMVQVQPRVRCHRNSANPTGGNGWMVQVQPTNGTIGILCGIPPVE